MAQQGDDAWGGPLSFLKIPAPYSQRPPSIYIPAAAGPVGDRDVAQISLRRQQQLLNPAASVRCAYSQNMRRGCGVEGVGYVGSASAQRCGPLIQPAQKIDIARWRREPTRDRGG
jgi:hypothetical protein